MPVDFHDLLRIVGREALRHVADGVDVAFEVAGEGHVGGGWPGSGEDGGRGVESAEQVRHDLVVVEGGADLEDGGEIPLQRPYLLLRNDQARPIQARLRDVRAEHALRDYLGLDPDLLPAPRRVQHREPAVEGVEAVRHPALSGRDLDEPLPTEPELQLHRKTRPLLRDPRAGPEPHRDTDLRPEVAGLDPFRLPVTSDEPPALHQALVGVTPEPQLLDAAGVALQAVTVVGLHCSPSSRRKDMPEILRLSTGSRTVLRPGLLADYKRFSLLPLPSRHIYSEARTAGTEKRSVL